MSYDLGQIVATPGALRALEEAAQSPQDLLQRHLRLDPGELSIDDQRANSRALKDGSRIFSAYKLSTGEKVWIITEAVGDDGRRASTCCLLPEDY